MTHLPHKLEVLHQSLIAGKLPRNLHWEEALELIGHVGSVEPTQGGEFAFVVGTQREFFRRPHGAELGLEDASRLRRLLKDAAAEPHLQAPPAGRAPPCRMLVVIDHHAAHVFRDLEGNQPVPETIVEPYDPHHFHHHLIHRKESHYRGDRVPEDTSFYEEVARALVPALQIVLIGHGTGKSSALDALVASLKKHHGDIAQRVVATETADLSALTLADVESLARRHLPQTF